MIFGSQLFLVPFLFTLMMGLISSKENPQKHSIELSKLSNNEIVPYYGHYKDTSSKTKLNEDVIRMFKAPLNMLSAKLESGTFVDVDHSLLKLGKDKVLIPRTRKDAVTKATAQIFLIMTCCAFAIILPCEENDSGARHFHFMLGINPALHWIVMLLFHLCIFILFVVLPVLILMAIFDKYETFTRLHYFLAVIILFMFGGSAMFLLQYMISLMLSTKAASAVYQVITVFATIVSFNCINLKLDSAKLADYLAIAQFFFYITPFPHIMNGMASVIENARLNAYCSINRQLCPKFIVDAEFEVSECCASKGDMISNYEYVFEGAPHSLLALAILTLMYAAIMGLYHTLYIQRYVEFLKFLVLSKEKEKLFDDQMVLQEEKYVMEAVEKRGTENQTHDILLINDVHKTYVSILSNYTYAVRGISLSVHKGECYGLLGVNGAGKSTTFKMLTGLTVPTRGDIYLDSYSISKHRKKYLQHISYCPQYDGLDMFLTLKENLRLVMDIKGFSNKDIKRELDAWILIVGLHNIANRPVGTYSGGGARRAVTACALASRCDLVTLDEPTAGVDVAARRKLWRAMQRAKASGASIMITSHSMDEMEVLCDRLCIMSKGQLRTLGTPDAVKAAHAYGYSYKIKIHDKNVSNDEEFKKLTEALQKTVMEQFKNKVSLKDKHKTMLNYHIQENIPYSQLFHMLANIKKSSVIVEDYSVSETTLEEVFIAFAREAKEMDRKNAKPKENGKEKEKEEKEKSENTEDDDDDEEEESKKKT